MLFLRVQLIRTLGSCTLWHVSCCMSVLTGLHYSVSLSGRQLNCILRYHTIQGINYYYYHYYYYYYYYYILLLLLLLLLNQQIWLRSHGTRQTLERLKIRTFAGVSFTRKHLKRTKSETSIRSKLSFQTASNSKQPQNYLKSNRSRHMQRLVYMWFANLIFYLAFLIHFSVLSN